MSVKTYDTDDWKLDAFIDWVPKNHREDCTNCNGKGEIGGGPLYFGDKEVCSKCLGTGFVTKGPTTPKPDTPKALIEHMRRAWWDFFNKE